MLLVSDQNTKSIVIYYGNLLIIFLGPSVSVVAT